jgi:hypothetical protein
MTTVFWDVTLCGLVDITRDVINNIYKYFMLNL